MSRATYEPPWTRLSPADLPGSHPRPGTTPARRARRAAYLCRLVAADGGAALVAATVGVATTPGIASALPAALPLMWVAALFMAHGYDRTVLREATEEFRRVILAAALVLGGAALIAWVGRSDIPRGFVALTLLLTSALTLGHRSLHRHLLQRSRAPGRHTQRTLLVGPAPGIAAMHEQLRRGACPGIQVIGCCLSTGGGRVAFTGLRVLGGPGDVADVVRRYDVDTVAVLPTAELDGAGLRRLGWDLVDTHAELVLAPTVTGATWPRVRIHPQGGIPLLQMETPTLRGPAQLVKGTVDRTAAGLILVLLLPVLLAVAVAVKVGIRGSVLVRQRRVGRDGRLFPLLTFRTTGRGPGGRLDPRSTRVGGFLRRHSLDQLPQLLNVLAGHMALVGPRPPLPADVERYGPDTRRFVVKPGLTGLSQVGRPWPSSEESVPADVRYAENWSLRLDLLILWRTLGAVIRASGA